MSDNPDPRMPVPGTSVEATKPDAAKDETETTTSNSTEDKPAASAEDTKKENTTSIPAAGEASSSTGEKGAGMKDNVFSMFGGGAKKEKKEADDDEGETSGRTKKDDDDADEPDTTEPDVDFAPVVHLTEKVEAATNEEKEEQVFKMRAKLFKFDRPTKAWRERGTGDVRLLKHKENQKTRLVMRQDKTLKVRANHYVVPDMKLSPNVGSDRSWVWNAAADVSEGEPEAQTLAIRFANSDNANAFKDAFVKAQQENEKLFAAS